jgi:hypothetical protein
MRIKILPAINAKVKYTLSSFENMLPKMKSMKRLETATTFNIISDEFLISEFEKILMAMSIKTSPKKIMLMRFPVFIKSRLSSINP